MVAVESIGRGVHVTLVAQDKVCEGFVPFSGSCVLGSDPTAQLRHTASGVSRRHAQLAVRSDALWITDLGSTNGTYVNYERVRQCALRPGDRVHLGDWSFEVHAEFAESAPCVVDPLDDAPTCVRSVDAVRAEHLAKVPLPSTALATVMDDAVPGSIPQFVADADARTSMVAANEPCGVASAAGSWSMATPLAIIRDTSAIPDAGAWEPGQSAPAPLVDEPSFVLTLDELVAHRASAHRFMRHRGRALIVASFLMAMAVGVFAYVALLRPQPALHAQATFAFSAPAPEKLEEDAVANNVVVPTIVAPASIAPADAAETSAKRTTQRPRRRLRRHHSRRG